MANDDGVGGDYQSRLALLYVIDFGLVNVHYLFGGRGEDIFEGGERLGQVLSELRGYDFEICEAYLIECQLAFVYLKERLFEVRDGLKMVRNLNSSS